MILITGATGNVGSEFARQLIAKNKRPRLYVRDAAKASTMISADAMTFERATKRISAVPGRDIPYIHLTPEKLVAVPEGWDAQGAAAIVGGAVTARTDGDPPQDPAHLF
jgi:nucleoside-diphosphate-sugar epimerase